MVTPRTLPALRSAVARVCVARGEAGDALVVRCGPRPMGGAGVICAIWPAAGVHPLEVYAIDDGGDEAAAIAAAWAKLDAKLSEEWERADDARVAAERALSQARAALAAAREAGE